MFEMEFKFSKISSMRSKALYVYVPPNQQHGWPLRPHHTLCMTELADRHLSKEMEKASVQKKSLKSLRHTDEFLL